MGPTPLPVHAASIPGCRRADSHETIPFWLRPSGGRVDSDPWLDRRAHSPAGGPAFGGRRTGSIAGSVSNSATGDLLEGVRVSLPGLGLTANLSALEAHGDYGGRGRRGRRGGSRRRGLRAAHGQRQRSSVVLGRGQRAQADRRSAAACARETIRPATVDVSGGTGKRGPTTSGRSLPGSQRSLHEIRDPRHNPFRSRPHDRLCGRPLGRCGPAFTRPVCLCRFRQAFPGWPRAAHQS